MAELEDEFPGIVEVEVMGRTHEGREIRGLRITSEEHLERESLPIVFVTGGVIAREWITAMTAVYLIHELVEHYEDYAPIVDNLEWFIIPVGNPDGYEFSRTPGVRKSITRRIFLTVFSAEPSLDKEPQRDPRL